MAHHAGRFNHFLRVIKLKKPLSSLLFVEKMGFSKRATKVIAAFFFCSLLACVDFALSKVIPGYFSGTVLYGCIFGFIFFGSDLVKKQEIKEAVVESTSKPAKEMQEKAPIQRATLSIEQCLGYKKQLNNHFEATNAFRKPGYSIRDLSNETGIPVYLISSFINQEYGMNFNELVNAYRVEYLAKMFKTSSDWESYTLEALGKMAGFNSRTAFIASIKKHTGMTPSAFFGRRECEKAEHPIFAKPERMADVA